MHTPASPPGCSCRWRWRSPRLALQCGRAAPNAAAAPSAAAAFSCRPAHPQRPGPREAAVRALRCAPACARRFRRRRSPCTCCAAARARKCRCRRSPLKHWLVAAHPPVLADAATAAVLLQMLGALPPVLARDALTLHRCPARLCRCCRLLLRCCSVELCVYFKGRACVYT